MWRALKNVGLAAVLVLAAACEPQPTPPPARGELAVVAAGSGDPAPAAVDAIRKAVDEELPRLSTLFRGVPRQRFFVHVHASRAGMPDALAAHLRPGSPGFTVLGARQVHVVWDEMRRTGANLRGVVVHELVHELLDQFVAPEGARLPRWFHEGLAQSIAGDTYLGASEEELIWRVASRRLLSFGDLRDDFPADEAELRIAYAQSYSYVAWLQGEYGLGALLDIAAAADERTTFEGALVGRTRRTTLELEDAWKDHLQYGSGAIWRVVLSQCFSLALIGALPLLVLALIRRLAADQRARARLERAEATDDPADTTFEAAHDFDGESGHDPGSGSEPEPAREHADDDGAGFDRGGDGRT